MGSRPSLWGTYDGTLRGDRDRPECQGEEVTLTTCRGREEGKTKNLIIFNEMAAMPHGGRMGGGWTMGLH